MQNGICRKIVIHIKRLSCEKAVTAVEFALVAPFFLILLFGIIETSLIFTTQVVIDGAAYDAARSIRTGRAQLSGDAVGEFKNQLCSSLFGIVGCDELAYDVKVYPDFASVAPIKLYDDDGNPLATSFIPGEAGDIVVVTVSYNWDFLFPLLPEVFNRKNMEISSIQVFRNEPFEDL